jgi:hypothetical protein
LLGITIEGPGVLSGRVNLAKSIWASRCCLLLVEENVNLHNQNGYKIYKLVLIYFQEGVWMVFKKNERLFCIHWMCWSEHADQVIVSLKNNRIVDKA